MIVRICIMCSWYDEKKGYCQVNKRAVNPNDSCEKFYDCSQDFLKTFSSNSQDIEDNSEPATYNLSKIPFQPMVKPSFI